MMPEGLNIVPMEVGAEMSGDVFHVLHRMIFARRNVCRSIDFTIGPVPWDAGAEYREGDLVSRDGRAFVYWRQEAGNIDPISDWGHSFWHKAVTHEFRSWRWNEGGFERRLGAFLPISKTRPLALWSGDNGGGHGLGGWNPGTYHPGDVVTHSPGGKWFLPQDGFMALVDTTAEPINAGGVIHPDWQKYNAGVELNARDWHGINLDFISAATGRAHLPLHDFRGASYQAAAERVCEDWGGVRDGPAEWVPGLPFEQFYSEGGRSFVCAVGNDRYVSEIVGPTSPPPGKGWYKIPGSEVWFLRSLLRFKCNGSLFEKSLDEIGLFDMRLDWRGLPFDHPQAGEVCLLGDDCPELLVDPNLRNAHEANRQVWGFGWHDVHPVWRRCWRHTMAFRRWEPERDYPAGEVVTFIDSAGRAWQHQCCERHISSATLTPETSNLETSLDGVWSAPDYGIPLNYPYHTDIHSGKELPRYWFVQTPTYVNGYVWAASHTQWRENFDDARVKRHSYEEIPAALINDVHAVLRRCDSGEVAADWVGGIYQQTMFPHYETQQGAISAAHALMMNDYDADNWGWGGGSGIGIFATQRDFDNLWEAEAMALAMRAYGPIAERLRWLGMPHPVRCLWLYELIIPGRHGETQPSVTFTGGTLAGGTMHNPGGPFELHCRVLDISRAGRSVHPPLLPAPIFIMPILPDANHAMQSLAGSAYPEALSGQILVEFNSVTPFLCD